MVDILNKFIPPILPAVIKKVKGYLKRSYYSGPYRLKTPPSFRPFQQKYPLYNKFLPVLAKHISSEQIIIDVGANIGDTTIDMIQHCKNRFYSIEGAVEFYNLMLENVKHLPVELQNRIKTFNFLAGTGEIGGEIETKNWGSASIKISEQKKSAHVALDSLIEKKTEVILLKSDTDGYDYDVILSAQEVLEQSEPILFWENQIDEDFQNDGYKKVYDLLTDLGYEFIFIFDNFGNVIHSGTDFETLRQINQYIRSMNDYGCTRTIYYTDVLACTHKYISLIRETMTEYVNQHINKKYH